MKEIERKFMVKDDSYKALGTCSLYKQGYIFNSPEKVIRVRIASGKGYLTIKGKMSGITRPEYEYEIPMADANELINNFCEAIVIEKKRYIINYQGFIWEVDEFLGDNLGLTIAEIELQTENTQFSKPDWVGAEVTYDPRYLNANLAKNPYNRW